MTRFWKSGDPFIWLTGGALALSLLMVAGLVLLVLLNGLGFFWPSPIVHLTLSDGKELLGQVMQQEVIPQPDAPPGTATRYRIQVKVGNRDLYGADFVWVEEATIARRDFPAEAVLIERREWGNLYGFLKEVRGGDNERAVVQGPEPAWSALQALLPDATSTFKEIRRIEKKEIGAINSAQEKIRLKLKKLQLSGQEGGSEAARLNKEIEGWAAKYREQEAKLATVRQLSRQTLIVSVIGDQETELPLQQIVRIVRPNSMGVWSKSGVYLSRLWEFISGDPRESNTEGGVFPAIFGTVMMVMIMSLLVAPLGVLAAFYLREY
ncbi:MAG TPA: phosphate ABC transporter, permease protein PstA, partial [Verrucomicrobiae bacterium]|nr:phosphate ABC transporter, permease protein PstA [Verrucomicrobiae bacterium]